MKGNRRFGETYGLHLLWRRYLARLIRLWWWKWCYSETSLCFQRTTWRYMLEDSGLLNHRCENLKSYKCLKYFKDISLLKMYAQNAIKIHQWWAIWLALRDKRKVYMLDLRCLPTRFLSAYWIATAVLIRFQISAQKLVHTPKYVLILSMMKNSILFLTKM
jgi:hypothetical protein